jgi:hypothetical protein
MDLRINKSELDNYCIAILLLLVLFIPNNLTFVRFYYLILLFGIPVLLSTTKKLYFDYLSVIGIGILLFHTLLTLVRFGFVVDPNIRDYTELIRFTIPVLLLIFRGKFKNLTLKTLFIVFAFYTSVDCLFSILDFLNLDIAGLISATKSLYAAPWHAGVAYRITGLSTGPGQHGVLMLIFFTFFYCRIFQKQRFLWPLFFSFISTIPIFLSQTRTAVVGFLLICVAVPTFYLVFGRKFSRRRSVPVLSSFIMVGGYLVIQFYDFFRRFFEILGGLENISSFQTRLGTYETLWEKAMEFPAFLVLGYGKEFFKRSSFDNEYLLMFYVYGPIITLIIVGSIIAYLVFFLMKNQKFQYNKNTILFFLLTVGLIVAFPATFFLETRILPLLFVFINLAYWENRSLNTTIP